MTDDICGRTAKSTGEPCTRPAGWGTDNDDGACKFHGGASPGAPEGNDNAVTVAAWAEDFVTDFLHDDEIDRVKDLSELLEDPTHAQEVAARAAGLALEQFRRTGDQRFLQRYESICDKAGIFPDERKEVEMTGEGGGPLEVTVERNEYNDE